jgi:hypothetical protein
MRNHGHNISKLDPFWAQARTQKCKYSLLAPALPGLIHAIHKCTYDFWSLPILGSSTHIQKREVLPILGSSAHIQKRAVLPILGSSTQHTKKTTRISFGLYPSWAHARSTKKCILILVCTFPGLKQAQTKLYVLSPSLYPCCAPKFTHK